MGTKHQTTYNTYICTRHYLIPYTCRLHRYIVYMYLKVHIYKWISTYEYMAHITWANRLPWKLVNMRTIKAGNWKKAIKVRTNNKAVEEQMAKISSWQQQLGWVNIALCDKSINERFNWIHSIFFLSILVAYNMRHMRIIFMFLESSRNLFLSKFVKIDSYILIYF